MDILTYQATTALARGPYTDLDAWTQQIAKCPFTDHVERALWGGFHADRLGYAFVAGYRAALARIFESKAKDARPLPLRVCLCATESGGAHPRAITTRLEDQGGVLVMNGEKTFATLANVSEELLVVVSRGVEDGKNHLRMVRVKPDATGVTIVPRDPVPFAPEIPHAIVRFTNVVVDAEDLLPGDGYDDWVKPFRTVEDTHVLASTVGYLQGAARAYDFDREAQAELLSLSITLIDIGGRDPRAPTTHIALAGLFASARRLIGSLAAEWTQKAEEEDRSRWERDLPLLMVADTARRKRTEAAWKQIESP